MKSLAFTLIFTLAILNIASLADASTLHNSNRILKKRTPAHLRRQTGTNNGGGNRGGGLGAIGAQGDPTVASQDTDSVTATPTTTGTTTSESVTTTSTTRRGGLVPGIVTPILGGGDTSSTTTTTTTSTSTSSTTSSSTTSAPTTSATPTSASTTAQPTLQQSAINPAVTQPPPIAAPPPQSTMTSTVTGLSAEESAAAAPPTSGATSHITRNTIIIIAAIAGSIGAVALIWTIIRKWKFSPSSSFEERMQPIDWQPTQDDGILGSHRGARPTSHGSFGSADYHSHLENRSHHGHQDLVSDLPPHDLLAGGSHQVGGGYADMHRGPSPPMSEGPQRGLSLNRGGQYDRYHDAYDYNGTGNTRGY